jgi:hypothetical protein
VLPGEVDAGGAVWLLEPYVKDEMLVIVKRVKERVDDVDWEAY